MVLAWFCVVISLRPGDHILYHGLSPSSGTQAGTWSGYIGIVDILDKVYVTLEGGPSLLQA